MRYEPMNEKVPVSPMQMSRPSTNQDYRQNSDIRRTRLIVLILLAIQLVLGLFFFIQRIVELTRYYRLPVDVRDGKLAGSYIANIIAAAISLIYLIIFIIVVVKYVRIGILIFAWLGIIELIFVIIVLIFAIIAVIAISAINNKAGVGIVASVIIIVIAGIACLLTILTVVFSFKLAKLIKLQQAYQVV